MVHVDRSTPVHRITDVTVTSQLVGDFAATHLSGDNSKVIATDMDLCMYFLKEAGVAVVPGAAFGLPGHFRISYAASDAELAEGMQRLTKACRDLRA